MRMVHRKERKNSLHIILDSLHCAFEIVRMVPGVVIKMNTVPEYVH